MPYDSSCESQPDGDPTDVLYPKRRRGRPAANVFRKEGAPHGHPYLEARRSIFLNRLETWQAKYPGRIQWQRYCREGSPDWELKKAAELAMAVMGRRAPEKLDDRPWHLRDQLTFDKEAMIFARWLRNELTENREGFKGPKPDFLKTWKAAISLAVARYVVTKNGRHYTKPPTPREIAQIWYVLFREHEPHDSIKSRLEQVARFCRQFAKDRLSLTEKERRYLRRAGDCVLRKLTPKSRRNSDPNRG